MYFSPTGITAMLNSNAYNNYIQYSSTVLVVVLRAESPHVGATLLGARSCSTDAAGGCC
eukprot:COSAG02_NODE_1079_length_14711_cov_86.326512_2_plen_59_part_00